MTSSCLVLRLRVPPGKKPTGEQRQVSWTNYQNVVRTNEIARLRSISLIAAHLYSGIRTLFECVEQKCF